MREASIASAGSRSSSLLDDAVSQALDPERLGRVRGSGLGVTPSNLNVGHHKSQREMHLEKQLKNLTNVMETMRVDMDRLAQRPVPPIDMPASSGPASHEPAIGIDEICLLLHWDGRDQVVARG